MVQRTERAPEAEEAQREDASRWRAERERLLAAAEGDQEAMRAIYRAHVDMVFRTASRVLGASDGDVDDVVQHTFLAAVQSAESFDGRSKLSTWLVGIATRRALDHARARHRRGRWDKLKEWVGIGPSAESTPDVRHQARTTAEKALDVLTLDQRTAFVLHEVEGHTLQEISEMTGVGISTLHARLLAGRKRLDAYLVEAGLARGGAK
jgi:RNA polymerase sigma-70 factor (ECF subfamily)